MFFPWGTTCWHPCQKNRGYSYCFFWGPHTNQDETLDPIDGLYPSSNVVFPSSPAPPTMKSSGLLVPSRRQRTQPWMVSSLRPISPDSGEFQAASWIDPPIWAHDLVMENTMVTGFHLESGWCFWVRVPSAREYNK